MQATGRVDDDMVESLRFGGTDGVVGDSGRIVSLFRIDDGNVEFFGPGLELFDGGGPERVGGAEHDGFAFRFVALGQFGDRRRLPGTVDTDDQLDEGLFTLRFDLFDIVDEEGDKGIVELDAFDGLGKRLDDRFDQIVGDIGFEKKVFEIFATDLFAFDGGVAVNRFDSFFQPLFQKGEHLISPPSAPL